MTPEAALAFVQEHGVVLASARGPAPRLAEAIAGEPIRGSWWAHPQGKQIFRVFEALGDSPDILVCRLVGGKLSFVHRRAWPALVRLAARFPPERLARVTQVHTEHGHHENYEVPFPQWVPAEVAAQAARLNEGEALAVFGGGLVQPWATHSSPGSA